MPTRHLLPLVTHLLPQGANHDVNLLFECWHRVFNQKIDLKKWADHPEINECWLFLIQSCMIGWSCQIREIAKLCSSINELGILNYMSMFFHAIDGMPSFSPSTTINFFKIDLERVMSRGVNLSRRWCKNLFECQCRWVVERLPSSIQDVSEGFEI